MKEIVLSRRSVAERVDSALRAKYEKMKDRFCFVPKKLKEGDSVDVIKIVTEIGGYWNFYVAYPAVGGEFLVSRIFTCHDGSPDPDLVFKDEQGNTLYIVKKSDVHSDVEECHRVLKKIRDLVDPVEEDYF